MATPNIPSSTPRVSGSLQGAKRASFGVVAALVTVLSGQAGANSPKPPRTGVQSDSPVIVLDDALIEKMKTPVRETTSRKPQESKVIPSTHIMTGGVSNGEKYTFPLPPGDYGNIVTFSPDPASGLAPFTGKIANEKGEPTVTFQHSDLSRIPDPSKPHNPAGYGSLLDHIPETVISGITQIHGTLQVMKKTPEGATVPQETQEEMTVLSDGTNLKFNPTQSLQEGFSATFTLQNGPEREGENPYTAGLRGERGEGERGEWYTLFITGENGSYRISSKQGIGEEIYDALKNAPTGRYTLEIHINEGPELTPPEKEAVVSAPVELVNGSLGSFGNTAPEIQVYPKDSIEIDAKDIKRFGQPVLVTDASGRVLADLSKLGNESDSSVITLPPGTLAPGVHRICLITKTGEKFEITVHVLEDPTIQSEIFRAEYDPVRRIFVVEAAGVETFGVWQVLPDGKRKFLPDVIDGGAFGMIPVRVTRLQSGVFTLEIIGNKSYGGPVESAITGWKLTPDTTDSQGNRITNPPTDPAVIKVNVFIEQPRSLAPELSDVKVTQNEVGRPVVTGNVKEGDSGSTRILVYHLGKLIAEGKSNGGKFSIVLPYGIPEGDQVFVVSAPDSQGMTHGAVETSEATIDFLSENDIGALDCERAPDGEDRFLCSVPLTGGQLPRGTNVTITVGGRVLPYDPSWIQNGKITVPVMQTHERQEVTMHVVGPNGSVVLRTAYIDAKVTNTPLEIGNIVCTATIMTVGDKTICTLEPNDPDGISSVSATVNKQQVPTLLSGGRYTIALGALEVGKHTIEFEAVGKKPDGTLEAPQRTSLDVTVHAKNTPLEITEVSCPDILEFNKAGECIFQIDDADGVNEVGITYGGVEITPIIYGNIYKFPIPASTVPGVKELKVVAKGVNPETQKEETNEFRKNIETKAWTPPTLPSTLPDITTGDNGGLVPTTFTLNMPEFLDQNGEEVIYSVSGLPVVDAFGQTQNWIITQNKGVISVSSSSYVASGVIGSTITMPLIITSAKANGSTSVDIKIKAN